MCLKEFGNHCSRPKEPSSTGGTLILELNHGGERVGVPNYALHAGGKSKKEVSQQKMRALDLVESGAHIRTSKTHVRPKEETARRPFHYGAGEESNIKNCGNGSQLLSLGRHGLRRGGHQ